MAAEEKFGPLVSFSFFKAFCLCLQDEYCNGQFLFPCIVRLNLFSCVVKNLICSFYVSHLVILLIVMYVVSNVYPSLYIELFSSKFQSSHVACIISVY